MSAPSSLPASVGSRTSPENVYDALAAWALRADRRLLAAWAVVGWADAVGIAVFLPAWWLLAMPLLSVSSLGVWGLASRRSRALEDSRAPASVRRRALSLVEAAAVVIGTLAAIIAFYGAFLLVLGRRWGPSGG